MTRRHPRAATLALVFVPVVALGLAAPAAAAQAPEPARLVAG